MTAGIASVGYDGLVDEEDWAWFMSAFGGAPYSVAGITAAAAASAGKVVAGPPSTPLSLVMSPGLVYGMGVLDDVTEPIPITCDPVTTGAGTSRYDLITMRRNWTRAWDGTLPGGESVPTVIKGSASRSMPTRLRGRGVQDDQPIALCRFDSGKTAVQEIIDLRTWVSPTAVSTYSMLGIDLDDWPLGTTFTVWTPSVGRPVEYRSWPRPAFEAAPELHQLSRSASSQDPFTATFDANGSASFAHNLGWKPTSMMFSFRAPSRYGAVVQLALSSTSPPTATMATITATITNSAGKTIPFTGTLAAVEFVAFGEGAEQNPLWVSSVGGGVV